MVAQLKLRSDCSHSEPARPRFLSEIELVTCPKRSAPEKVDPCNRLRLAIVNQLLMLDGHYIRGRRWYRSTPDTIYCQLRIGNKTIMLDGTNDRFKAGNLEEAKVFYKQAMQAAEAGEFKSSKS